MVHASLRARSLAALAALALFGREARCQDTATGSLPVAGAAVRVEAGAQTVALLTRVAPLVQGGARTEGYLTQPALFGRLDALRGRVEVRGVVSLEGLTLERGELGPGAYGEGYVDRRHPHTYLHELMLTVAHPLGEGRASLSLGRGFVPFGTEDPMMRPFVKFPVNHHLAQVLERSLLMAALRQGPVRAEVALFHGAEPMSPTDLGTLDRFGDSWAARVSVEPARGLELQASRAWVVSPEMPRAQGNPHRKWSASARHQAPWGEGRLYVLGEWASTTEVGRGASSFTWDGWLVEAELEREGWRGALRLERAERPEEERSVDPFRSPWPHADPHRIGVTRWTTLSLRLQRGLSRAAGALAPFGEVALSRVSEVEGGIFDPYAFYGGDRIWTLSLGARLRVGWHPREMGRYGAGAATLAPGVHAAGHH